MLAESQISELCALSHSPCHGRSWAQLQMLVNAAASDSGLCQAAETTSQQVHNAQPGRSCSRSRMPMLWWCLRALGL